MRAAPSSKSSDPVRTNRTTDAFSLYAPTYDSEQASNLIAKWSRKRNLAVLDRAFPAGSRVLEVGCGTGAEAIYLARRGVSVVATDAAPGMISVLRDKLSPGGPAYDVSGRIETLILPASRLATLRGERPDDKFDGAYSSFGPLNCEPDLQGTLDELARLVKPGGPVVISLLTKFCLWETAWHLLHGDITSAFRRWGGAAEATVRDEWRELRIPVYYWSTRRVRRLARPHFKVERQMALPWLLPPQYLAGLVGRFPSAFRLLARTDRKLAAAWPFYALGDHYLVVLVRRDH